MRKRSGFCNFYRAMSEHKTCEAGVEYSRFQGVPFGDRPCFFERGVAKVVKPENQCDKCQYPTEAELQARDRELQKMFDDTEKARDAIEKHLGGPWKKGTPGEGGLIDCPVCQGKASLRFTRSGYNGHIHAWCSTEGCVTWME